MLGSCWSGGLLAAAASGALFMATLTALGRSARFVSKQGWAFLSGLPSRLPSA